MRLANDRDIELAKGKATVRKWAARAKRLSAAHAVAEFTTGASLRDCLAELWLLLDHAPDEVHRTYRDLPENRIGTALRRLADELVAGKLPWNGTGSIDEVVLELAAALRAVDAMLVDLPAFVGRPLSGKTLLSRKTDVFVIPRGRAKATDRQEGPGATYHRRATPNHSVVPREIDGGYTVEGVVNEKLGLPIERDRKVMIGAALFPGQKIDWVEHPDGYIADGVTTEDDEKLIGQHVEGAFVGAPFAAIWPELSMSERRRKMLSEKLQNRSGGSAPLQGPRLVVAGSWHEQIGDSHENVMRILDGEGEERLRFAKVSKFRGKNVAEGNTPSKVLKVLWTQDCLVSFAICSDFCDMSRPEPPFLRLDVDLILVPSLGHEGALKGHEANASRRKILSGGQTAVVQQHEESDDPVGWVIPAETDGSLKESRAWSLREIDAGTFLPSDEN